MASNTSKLKFAANISMMWSEEVSLPKRYSLAKAAGFESVECTFPYNVELQKLTQAKLDSGLEQVLINSYPGDLKNGELGFAALSHKISEFKKSLDLSLEYAKALDCKRIHIMAGKKPTQSCNLEEMEETFVSNLRYASDVLQTEGITGLIEPLNGTYTAPNYFLDNFELAARVLKKVERPNIKLQLDIYHLQVLHGNLAHNVEKYLPMAGHVQVAQPPRRSEPGSEGEIDYCFVFKLLQRLGWSGHVALEYTPTVSTDESLQWLKAWESENNKS